MTYNSFSKHMEVHGHARLLVYNNLFCDWVFGQQVIFSKKIPLDVKCEFLFWCEWNKIFKDMFLLANENQEL